MTDKKKILMLCDHPLIPSGVGTQAKYLIEGLIRTGKFKFVVFGGAVKHPDYTPIRVNPEEFGDDGFLIFPVDGYGDKQALRATLAREKPDAVLLFTDPRFFIWVWEMEDEIRSVCPLLYWHVWDNDPAPKFNKVFYESTDYIVSLSLKTKGLLQDLKYPRTSYIPHAVDSNIFKPLPEEERKAFRQKMFGPHVDKEFVVFWNNRNARRKMTGDVIASFSKFAHKHGKKKFALAMHTNVSDPEGQNLVEVARTFDVEDCMLFSEARIPANEMNAFYNACDVTINIANNEGFGLGTLESLMAGVPIIVHMTGGLQFQIGDWWKNLEDFSDQDHMTMLAKNKFKSNKSQWFGVPVFPSTRSCTGSQPIPYIYDDRVSHEDVVDALSHLHKMGRESRQRMGLAGREWASKTFSMKDMLESWEKVLDEQIDLWKSKRDSKKYVIKTV